MIKFNGLNYKKGCGSYLLFGQYFNGDGGTVDRTRIFSNNFFNKTGSGMNFGDVSTGGGGSLYLGLLKQWFLKK